MATKRKPQKRKSKNKPPVIKGNSKQYANVVQTIKKSELSFHRNFARQFVTDAACLAVYDVFGAAEIGQEKFLASLSYWLMEMSELTLEDAKDDEELVYMKEVLDRRLKPILGKNFRPYDERYSQ